MTEISTTDGIFFECDSEKDLYEMIDDLDLLWGSPSKSLDYTDYLSFDSSLSRMLTKEKFNEVCDLEFRKDIGTKCTIAPTKAFELSLDYFEDNELVYASAIKMTEYWYFYSVLDDSLSDITSSTVNYQIATSEFDDLTTSNSGYQVTTSDLISDTSLSTKDGYTECTSVDDIYIRILVPIDKDTTATYHRLNATISIYMGNSSSVSDSNYTHLVTKEASSNYGYYNSSYGVIDISLNLENYLQDYSYFYFVILADEA